jgi:hypothetical protein
MMVYVNGQDIARIVLGVIDNDQWRIAPGTLSVRPEEYLLALEQFLADHQLAKESVTGFVVIVGPGSATALRASLTMVNTLAFALGVPVTPCEKFVDDSDQDVLHQLVEHAARSFVLPIYAHEPKITSSNRDTLKRKAV